ncbi:MAG: hypothetical protein WDM85_07475 [Caulobacteraceae bacterium]
MVNDDAEVLGQLMRAFVETRIKPYYLHHGDLAPGTAHFRTSLEAGQALMRQLRGDLSGPSPNRPTCSTCPAATARSPGRPGLRRRRHGRLRQRRGRQGRAGDGGGGGVKYLHLVWAGVWRRPGRATLTLLSIVNAFLLYGLLQGFVSGIGNTVAETHADVLITASRISQLEPLPMSQLPQIRGVPGVKSAAPIVIFHGAYRSSAAINVRGFAVEPDSFAAANSDETIPRRRSRR